MLTTRIISAIVAVFVIAFLYSALENDGLKILVILGALLSSYEMMRILFSSSMSRAFQWLFFVFAFGTFVLCSYHQTHAGALFAFSSILYCLSGLFLQKEFNDLGQLQTFISKSILGFFYVGLLPSLTIQILSHEKGTAWFLTMLIVVFAGDIGAYIFGLSLGKHKLMPKVSPKKTIEGSIGGLIFSITSGVSLLYWFPLTTAMSMMLLCFIAALFAQMGDLFESLLKRVADVKDSGKIFPGHGGILDRIDGILFACPVFLLGIQFFGI